MKKKIIINIFNISILLLIFSFVLIKHRYAIICNDDMLQTIARTYMFLHTRIITEPIVTFIVKQIPEIFNINYQDFAFISEGIIRSAFIIAIIHCITKAFFKLKNHNPIFRGIFYILSFFIFFSILIKYNYISGFNDYPCFSYVTPILFFVLFWYKLAEFYILQKSPDKKDIIYLTFLVILNTFGDEYYNLITLFLLSFIFIENIITKKDINYIKIPMLVFIPCFIFYYSFHGFKDMYDSYELSISFHTAYNHYQDFFISLVKVLFAGNWVLYIPIIIALIVLFITRKQSDKNLRIIKYFFITYAGFLFVMIGTIVFPANCPYSEEIKYWFMHCGLLTEYTIFLYISGLFIYGAIDTKKYLPIFIICCVIYTYLNFSFEAVNFIHSNKYARRLLYIDDKLSLFYFNQGKTAIIPREQIICLFSGIFPDELAENKEYNNKIFYKEDELLYLVYLEKNYGIDVSPGLMFMDEKDAINQYLREGGKLEEKELEELKFYRIAPRKNNRNNDIEE